MSNNTYMREYMRRRYHARIKDAHAHLGGKCAECGRSERLQIDHANPKQKAFVVAGQRWNARRDVWLKELEKCQLLCHWYHVKKTNAERWARIAARKAVEKALPRVTPVSAG